MIASIWGESMLGYLSLDKYLLIFVLGQISVPRSSVFLELRSWKTVRFSEQIMSGDKYSIFLC